jgi:release factor glutamine methyltransferase
VSASGSVGQARADATGRLRDAGFAPSDAAIDADVLLRHVLAWDRATLLLRRDDPLPPAAAAAFDALVARRCTREPVAYLTGTREFYGRDFHVSPAVLIPRPETELIVDAVLARTTPAGVCRIADVCTGSGILAVTLACERPHCAVVATDVSTGALAIARKNAAAHGVTDRVTFIEADLLTIVPGPFDVIVANPPYVPERDAPTLAPDVRAFEPGIALFGGEDGLAVVARLVQQASTRLVAGGLFVMEFGAGQQYDVARHATSAGFEVLEVARDLQGHPRIVVCRLRADL